MKSYLDHNASVPLLGEAKRAMLAAMEFSGNPSSIHQEGRSARKIIEDARNTVADVFGVMPKQVIFTSGATEAAQTALGTWMRIGNSRVEFSHLYISSIEHPCILAGGRFDSDRVTKFGVTEAGLIDLGELEKVLQTHDFNEGKPLVAAMLANNETGVIQPIAEIAKLVRSYEGFLCVDAVQAFGKIEIDFADLNAHMVFVSGHKIGAPKGVGALVMMNEAYAPQPLIRGGGQENLLRAGTENVFAIAGLGAAVSQMAKPDMAASEIKMLRDEMESGLEEISRQSGNEVPLPVFFGASAPRLDNTSCFAVEGVKAETALIALDLNGISVSSGSACSSGRVNQSHVLQAMGVSPDLAECTLRVSIGNDTTRTETEHFLNVWKNIVEKRV